MLTTPSAALLQPPSLALSHDPRSRTRLAICGGGFPPRRPPDLARNIKTRLARLETAREPASLVHILWAQTDEDAAGQLTVRRGSAVVAAA
jgi:hypothetical protein